MRQVRQLVCVLFLYLQFHFHDVSTLDVDVTSKDHTSDANQMIGEWKCKSDDECTPANSTCVDNLCQCQPGYILSSDLTACLRVATKMHDSCEDNLQCSAYLFSGGRCVDKICVCGPSHYYLHGRCNRYVGLYEKCEQNIDCYVNAEFEASTCTKGICKCSPGFYQREHRTCRLEGKAVGDPCMIDLDCTANNMYCDDNACTEKPESEIVEFSRDIQLAERDAANEPLLEVQEDRSCTDHEDCKDLENAVCDATGTCRCARAHFELVTDTGIKCIPELGESCNELDNVTIEHSVCRKGMWSCAYGMVASNDNSECLKATAKYQGKCHQDMQCYVFGPNAVCKGKKCVCDENSRYIKSEMFCWANKGYGETCVEERDCYVEDFEGELLLCKDGTCSCPKDTHVNSNRTACISNSAEVGDICEMDADCTIRNSVCKDDVCECKDNYYLHNRQCLSGINSTCAKNEDCRPDHSSCVSKVCACNSDYVAVTVGLCMPISSYGESCSYDVQCSVNIPDAICAPVKEDEKEDVADATRWPSDEAEEMKFCTCNKADHYKFGRCYKRKLIDEVCANLGECYAIYDQEKVICMNGKCTCNWGYMKSNSNLCVRDLQAASLPNNDANNVAPVGLLSMVFLIFICNFL